MKCWAEDISDCEGPQSGEHPVSRGLFDSGMIRVRGLPFCGEEIREIPRNAFKSNILCKRHNELLSDLDQEAIRLKRILLGESLTSQSLPDGAISIPLIKRWIAKTYCNFMVLGEYPIDPAFVRCAYGLVSAKTFHLYLWRPSANIQLNHRLVERINDEHFHFGHYFEDSWLLLFIRFFGLRFVFTNWSPKNKAVLELPSGPTIDTRDLQTGLHRIQLHREVNGHPDSYHCVEFSWDE